MTQSFAEQATQDPQGQTEAQASATPDIQQPSDQDVALIVGERAFKTMDDVKNKISNADEHIARIEQENKEFRERLAEYEKKLETSSTVEDLLKNQNKESNGLDESKLDELLDTKLSMREQMLAKEANRKACMEESASAYGKDYIASIAEKAASLGMDMTMVDALAETSPSGFKELFLPKEPASSKGTSHSSTIRTSHLQETPPAPQKGIFDMTSKERTNNLIAALEAANKQ